MTVLDDKLIPKAKEIIEKYGKEVTFVDETRTANAATGLPTFTSVERKIKVSPPDEYDRELTDGAMFKVGDTKVILPAKDLTWEPKRSMYVKIDTVVGTTTTTTRWSIVRVTPMLSGDKIAAYELHLRI